MDTAPSASSVQASQFFVTPFSEAYVCHIEEAVESEIALCVSEFMDRAIAAGQRPYSPAEQKSLEQTLCRSALRKIQRTSDECRGKVFLAFERETRKMAGLVAVKLDDRLIPPRRAEILIVGVAYRFRRQGLGRMLVSLACKHLQENCMVQEVTVCVDSRQAEVVNFCKANGFLKHCYEWSFPCTPIMARFHRFLQCK